MLEVKVTHEGKTYLVELGEDNDVTVYRTLHPPFVIAGTAISDDDGMLINKDSRSLTREAWDLIEETLKRAQWPTTTHTYVIASNYGSEFQVNFTTVRATSELEALIKAFGDTLPQLKDLKSLDAANQALFNQNIGVGITTIEALLADPLKPTA
jgi:hypothetical protein